MLLFVHIAILHVHKSVFLFNPRAGLAEQVFHRTGWFKLIFGFESDSVDVPRSGSGWIEKVDAWREWVWPEFGEKPERDQGQLRREDDSRVKRERLRKKVGKRIHSCLWSTHFRGQLDVHCFHCPPTSPSRQSSFYLFLGPSQSSILQ